MNNSATVLYPQNGSAVFIFEDTSLRVEITYFNFLPLCEVWPFTSLDF